MSEPSAPAPAPSPSPRPARDIAVLLRRDALGAGRAAEGLRNAVGLTLEPGNRVTAILLDDAVQLAAAGVPPASVGAPDTVRPIATLLDLKHAVWAESESLGERGLAAPVRPGIEVKSREQICNFLARCDVVVTW